MDKYMDVLCNCPLFKGKEKKEIKDSLSRTEHKVIHYQKNDFIFRADHTPAYLGIVLKGSIDVQNNLESGKYFNVFYKKKGEVFGGALVFSNIQNYKFNIIAKTHCDILLIAKQSFLEVLAKDQIIVANILNLLAKSVLMLNHKIELFSHSSIQKKIAYSLLYNIQFNPHNTIHLPYSKKDWAEHLNVSRPSLLRELKKLVDAGIIAIDKKTIKVLQKDHLASILNNP